MELNININTDKYCNVIIKDNSTYLDELSTSINPALLKFSDTVSIIGINHTDTRVDLLSYYYTNIHNIETSFKIPINFDGVFTVNYIIIPTKDWYDRILKSVSKEQLIEAFGGRIYIYNNDSIIEITPILEQLIKISDFINSQYSDNLSVSVKNKKLLSICKLHKCYVNLCLQIFNNKNFSSCWNKNKVDSELVYKRDLVWMTINVITYLWNLGNNDEEIARVLLQINKCNGLCEPYPNDNSSGKQNGCGCSSN